LTPKRLIKAHGGEFCIWEAVDGELAMTFGVKANKRNDDYLYHVWLFTVTDDELDLSAGRFSRFVDASFENRVILPWDEGIGEWVEWISDNCQDKWSLEVAARHVSDVSLVFSFESHVDGVHFALRWR
jgi:hypothetical protein